MNEHPTGTVTLVFTDLESSSELSERHGAAFETLRMQHFSLLRAAAAGCMGYEIETAGDALFVAFSCAADAIRFSVAAQCAMANHDWPEEVGTLRVRIGMHTGEPFIGNDGGRVTYRGPVTNRAARVQSAAHGGQVIISDATYHAAHGSAPLLSEAGITFQDCGIHRLKGVGEGRLWQVVHPQLTHAFPPLNTLDPLRHNLPVPVGPLIGRDDEISAWRALICPPGNDEMSRTGARLLTLTGMGGLGKTRAALQLAELCIGNFADGVWWIALDEVRDGEAVFDRIAAALRLSLSANSSVREQVIAYLRERQILLVLDNTEQISDAPDAVTHLLNATERLRLLVTSRRALQLYAECVREVRPLASSEAIRLFAERACALRPFELTQHNEADVLELCRRLEGVPLAIELAASRIGVASPREMLRHLNERFRLLQTRAPDLPPRQRALRGAFDWSYELLTPDNQTVFAQLAVFAGGFFTEGAMAVCDSFEALDGVAELRSQSLLRSRADAATQQTRFSMLESVREYALEKLGASGPLAQETRERHAAYFERQAFEWRQALRARRNETATLAAMDADADNVRSAFEWVCHHGSADAKASLGLSLGVYCRLRGRAQEANDAVEAGLKAVESSGSLSEAELHRERASLCLDRFETDAARACAETALELFSSQNALSGVAETENLLGLISNQQGELTSARRNLSSALAHFKAEGDDVGVAKARNNLALIELSALAAGDTSTDLEAAAGHLQAALALHRKNDDRRGLAETLTNLGVLAQETGEFSVAWRYYLDALAVECELDFTLGIARTLYNLGEVAEVRGDNSAATRLARSAAWFFHEIGSPLERYAVTLAERTTGHLTHEEKQQVDAGANFSSLPRNDILKWALGDSETLAPSLIPSSALRP